MSSVHYKIHHQFRHRLKNKIPQIIDLTGFAVPEFR
jgi:hypothetical protein